MNKREFLRELEYALEGKLSKSDITEITADYSDIFDNGVAAEKSEDDIAKEIGSPAKIARTILEDGVSISTPGGDYHGNSKGQRDYTDFQKNINEKTSKIFDKVIEPDKDVKIDTLAPMSSRLGAYIIDCIILGILSIGLIFIVLAPMLYVGRTVVMESGSYAAHQAIRAFGGIDSTLYFSNMIILLVIFSSFNLFTAIFLWATNGYTPGKWLLKIRVVKINGLKLSFLDAFLRDVVIKCIANALFSGFLNVGSFIWGCLTDDHKTIHDLVAQTRVVISHREVKMKKTSNPFE